MLAAMDWAFDRSLWPAYFVACFVFYLTVRPYSKSYLDVPTVKFNKFLPNFFNRLLFFIDAPAMVQYGYTHFAGKPFQILKPDGDLIILPDKYMDEIKVLPPNKISLLHAQHRNVLGEYINILLDSQLPAFTVAKKLTPALNRIVPRTIDELTNAFPTVIPECKDRWVPIGLYDTILSLMSRTTSRIIVGDDLCRDENWLNLLIRYTNNVGITIFLLRPFPKVARPLIARWLPSVRKLAEQLAYATDKLFVPMIKERRIKEETDPNYQKPDDFVQWMMDAADNEYDKRPEVLSQGIMTIVALAVVHTSTMLTTHAIYDLILMPDVLETLRQEIPETLKDGWKGTTQAQLLSQRRMDSFLRESHRFNPTSEVTAQRICLEELVLSDGFVLPKGSHICFPSGPMSRDSEIIEDADTFDPWRWCKDVEAPNYLVTIGRTNMHFGYGRQACPGRFYATNTIKAILSRFLMEYDFKFERDMKRRPYNVTNGDHIMPNMKTRVLIKERGVKI
ncbi:cytochrome P450 [Aspergillus melleus]|uniref:cytochrome P450 n=1 Tax=Aspergillus melleus TaxID=138277 RepID=UPI001E8E0EE5|nr:uncharacterized protein LDX57_012185 [Aspergillus melleus]KAH8434542.1 hypothetical protein LDX57_012185 [Aspergillus melleus]